MHNSIHLQKLRIQPAALDQETAILEGVKVEIDARKKANKDTRAGVSNTGQHQKQKIPIH